VPLSARLQPLALASASACPTCEQPGARLLVSGFGNTQATSQASSNPSTTLKYVEQQLDAGCGGNAIPTSDFCAGPIPGQTGTDSCQGDSGGSIVHQANGVWYSTGVVSSGTQGATDNGPAICGGAGTFGIYTSVSRNRAFIDDAMSNNTNAPGFVATGVGAPAGGSSISLGIIIGAAVGGVVVITLIILLIVCCCQNHRHATAQKNIRKQQHLASRPPAGGPSPRPVSPRPVSPRSPNKAHLPPARPEYSQPQPQPYQPSAYGEPLQSQALKPMGNSNPAYGQPTNNWGSGQQYDPAMVSAPPPPVAPAPVVYTPAPVVYTPNNAQNTPYGRM